VLEIVSTFTYLGIAF